MHQGSPCCSDVVPGADGTGKVGTVVTDLLAMPAS